MLKLDRQDAIVALCDARGTVTVGEVSRELSVSEMTVRRDLAELDAEGRLERVHGGARTLGTAEGHGSGRQDPHGAGRQASRAAGRHGRSARALGTDGHGSSPVAGVGASPVGRELTHREKGSLHKAEKETVAKAAAALVEPGRTVFIGTGTTCEALAHALPDVPLRVVTNSLSVLDALSGRDSVDLCVVGGDYRRSTDAFVGPVAEQAVATLGVDAAFIGCNGVSPDGFSTSNAEEGRLQRLVLDRAERRYIVCDASKVGRRDFYTFHGLDGVTAVVCDKGLSGDGRAVLTEHAVIWA